MDNFFEILIYIIIIISFLSSILKKKKQKPKQPAARTPQQEEYPQKDVSVAQTQPKEEYDILKELEDFFKVGEEPKRKQIPVPGPQQQKEMPDMGEHTQEDSWHSTTVSEHSYTNNWGRKKEEVKKIISKVDASIEKQAAKFEESLQRKETEPGQLALIVKSKLGNPASLKEYIIFSEILGKPKALRR
jgi:hypothetical protein